MYYLLSPYNRVFYHVWTLHFLLWSPFFTHEMRFLSNFYKILDILDLILFHE